MSKQSILNIEVAKILLAIAHTPREISLTYRDNKDRGCDAFIGKSIYHEDDSNILGFYLFATHNTDKPGYVLFENSKQNGIPFFYMDIDPEDLENQKKEIIKDFNHMVSELQTKE